jgi:hypothetical protein
MAERLAHPKEWIAGVAQGDMDDNRSWANTSPYREEINVIRKMHGDTIADAMQATLVQRELGTRMPVGMTELPPVVARNEMKSALDRQENGDHYRSDGVQPIQFITSNHLSFVVGNIIKYAYRADKKGGAEDLFKAIHYAQIELETKYGVRSEIKYDKP